MVYRQNDLSAELSIGAAMKRIEDPERLQAIPKAAASLTIPDSTRQCTDSVKPKIKKAKIQFFHDKETVIDLYFAELAIKFPQI